MQTKQMTSRELYLDVKVLEALAAGYKQKINITDTDLVLTNQLLESLRGQLTMKKTPTNDLFASYVTVSEIRIKNWNTFLA